MTSEENDLSELTESKTKALVVVTAKQQKVIKDLVAVAPIVVITTNEEYTEAGARLVQVKANIKALDAVHTEISGPLDNAMKDIKTSVTKLKAFFDIPRQKLLQAEVSIKGAMGVYLKAAEEKRAAEQKLLDDAAAKEKARIKALADAAAKKAEDDAAAARKAAADAVAAGRAAEAKQLADKADKIDAKALVRADIAGAKIASLGAPVLSLTVPKAAGTTSRKTWVFEVYDQDVIPREYLMLDEKKVKAAIAAGERAILGLIIKQDMSIVGTGK